jgi:hypothetical protein
MNMVCMPHLHVRHMDSMMVVAIDHLQWPPPGHQTSHGPSSNRLEAHWLHLGSLTPSESRSDLSRQALGGFHVLFLEGSKGSVQRTSIVLIAKVHEESGGTLPRPA